jgi:hypothetical protein
MKISCSVSVGTWIKIDNYLLLRVEDHDPKIIALAQQALPFSLTCIELRLVLHRNDLSSWQEVPVSRMTHIEHVTHVWSSLQQQRDHMSLN